MEWKKKLDEEEKKVLSLEQEAIRIWEEGEEGAKAKAAPSRKKEEREEKPTPKKGQ